MSTYRLQNLLSPRSVALVGASPRHGSVGRAILGNIHKAKFKGEFGLVNNHYPEIDGVVTVDSLGKLPFVPELVVITAPAAAVVGLIDEAGKHGAVGALIVSAGLGHGAGSLADAAERAAQKYGMRLIGPNCLGIMMPSVALNASFAAHMPSAGNLALISQSEVFEDRIALPSTRTKNGRAHSIPLTAAMRKILDARVRDDEFVFGARYGRPFSAWGSRKRALDQRLSAAGAEIEPWTQHDLRRTLATWLAESGILPNIIEAILNHVSGHKAGVAGIYNRATYEPQKRAALER
jgi:predicted CoA-binding protein